MEATNNETSGGGVVNVAHLQNVLEEHDRNATYCDNDNNLRSGRSICNRLFIMGNLLVCSPLIAAILFVLYKIGLLLGLRVEEGRYDTFAYAMLTAMPLASLLMLYGDRRMLTVIPDPTLTQHTLLMGRYVPRFILTSSCCFCQSLVTRSQLVQIAWAHSLILTGYGVAGATAFMVCAPTLLGDDGDPFETFLVVLLSILPCLLYYILFKKLLVPATEQLYELPTDLEAEMT